MRCPHCGTNQTDSSTPCPGCGTAPVPAQVRVPQQAWTLPQMQWQTPATWEQQPLTGVSPHDMAAQLSAASLRLSGDRQNGDLCGHVLVVEQGHPEPPPFNFCRLLSGLVWLLVLVLSPVALFLLLLKGAGGLSALAFLIVAFFGAKFLVGFLMPGNLLSLFHLHSFLNPSSRRHQDDLPVYFMRVRNQTGDEAEVRLQGRLTRGNVRMDDWMTFWGRWRGGVLDARRAWNHRTGSWVELHETQSWVGLAIALVALILVLSILSLSVISFAPTEAPTFPHAF